MGDNHTPDPAFDPVGTIKAQQLRDEEIRDPLLDLLNEAEANRISRGTTPGYMIYAGVEEEAYDGSLLFLDIAVQVHDGKAPPEGKYTPQIMRLCLAPHESLELWGVLDDHVRRFMRRPPKEIEP